MMFRPEHRRQPALQLFKDWLLEQAGTQEARIADKLQ